MATTSRADERAARAALSRFHDDPADLAHRLDALGAVDLWHTLRTADPTGPLADYDAPAALDAAKLTAEFVIPTDPQWPTSLDALGAERPLGLWVRGGPGPLNDLAARSVTITGSRTATEYGQHVAGTFAQELAEAEWTVSGGLTAGIDASAHRAALAVQDARMLAVLPCGLDLCHPYRHADLMRRLLDSGGCAVSACTPGTPATGVRLRIQRRLLAALSAGVVVVEAATECPALETAATARALGRPVMAVPGPVTSGESAGVHRLMGDGTAQMVTSAVGVLAVLAEA